MLNDVFRRQVLRAAWVAGWPRHQILIVVVQRIIKPPLAIAKAPLRVDAVHLFGCLSVAKICTQKRDFLKKIRSSLYSRPTRSPIIMGFSENPCRRYFQFILLPSELIAVRAAWLRWSATLGSRPELAGSLCQVIAACALRLNSRAGTEGSTVSSLICDRWLMLGLEKFSISRCLNHW